MGINKHTDPSADSREVERAKEIARGPLGKELSKYPILFATSVNIIEERTNLSKSALYNGTATLITLSGKHIAITCDHVLHKYDQIIGEGKNAQLQVGNLNLDPSISTIDRNSEVDISTLDLEPYNLDQISLDKNMGDRFITPFEWPPPKIMENDLIITGGFPRVFRKRVAPTEFLFASLSIGPVPVSRAYSDEITCRFEREYWVSDKNPFGIDINTLDDLGGLSGSPVFKYDQTQIRTFEFVGIVFEYCRIPFDLLKIRLASVLDLNGKILT